MPKVLCTLPNASNEINGITFSEHAKGMLSDEISDELAEQFAAIPGYSIVGVKAAAAVEPADDDARAALLARAEAIGFKVKSTWGIDRLTSEVEAAEKAHAETVGDAPAAE